MIERGIAVEPGEIAPVKKRVIAFVIDDLVANFLFLAIFWSQITQLRTVEEINLFLADHYLSIVALQIAYHTFLVWQSGMTLGKYAVKIRVVSLASGEIPSLPVALLRAMIRILSQAFFYLGFMMAFFNPMVQTLHDKLSGCVVVDA